MYDRSEMSEQKRNIWRTIPVILIPVFITTMIISMIALLRPGIEQKQFDELAELVHTTEPGELEEDSLVQNNEATIPADTTYSEVLHTECPSTEPMELEQYRAIHEKNPDTFGGIYIEGTSVDYPVMHTPDDPERYLRKNFDGNYSNSGVPFMAAECFEGCGNYILYGHNMKNGSMFNNILFYKDESFMRDHPIIKFDTMNNMRSLNTNKSREKKSCLPGLRSLVFSKF